MTPRWTTVDGIRHAVRRRLEDETLLRAHAARAPFPGVTVRLRGPRPAEIGDDLAAAQAWVAAIEAGSRGGAHYTVEYADVGGRLVGRNRLPGRAHIASYAQAWALLGASSQIATYDDLLATTASEPAVREWVSRHPLRALTMATDWPALMAAFRWLVEARGSGLYLRQITAPGVDTKFVEKHRGVLAQLLGVPASSTGFLAAMGLARKPETVRLRAASSLGVLGPFSEAVLPRAELADVALAPSCAVIVENETTYLSLPLPRDGVLLWGKGFDVDSPGSLPWLGRTEVHYWGDLDTHGFAILDRLRAWVPDTRSFLMDRRTLLQHRERWGREESPTRAALDRLTADEAALYADLVSDRYGDRVRLEQERVDWSWVKSSLPYPGGAPDGGA